MLGGDGLHAGTAGLAPGDDKWIQSPPQGIPAPPGAMYVTVSEDRAMNHGQYRGHLLGALVLTAAAAAPAFAQTAPAPTFTKDIAPIFQAKCESCHRPDSIAPMSLVTYEQSRPWARSIRDRVQ